MKKILALALIALALPALTASAAELPALDAPSVLGPACTPAAARDLAPAFGMPAPRQVSCQTICSDDFKACRNSCHTLACYFQCRDAYDECIASC